MHPQNKCAKLLKAYSFAQQQLYDNNNDDDVAVEEEEENAPAKPADEDERPQFTSLGPVYKSPMDTRQYKAIQLNNGMKVVLISTLDVKAAKSSKKKSTCHLKKVLDFNSVCIGLDSSAYKIRCECEGSGPVMVDKSTSTDVHGSSSVNGRDSSATFMEAINALKSLLYGDTDSTLSTASKTSTQPNTEPELDEPDDDSQVATAFLTVGAGWFNDPEDVHGMSHLVEHCFFLGSKKFPFPNQLFRLILPHGGYANAYTGGTQTVYTVSVSLEIFALALEMLADGIGFPVLPKDLVTKEINALDAEFSLRQEDIPKYSQLLASLSRENHPLRKMDTGNQQTLKVPQFYKKLIEWREAHYCAEYMTLAVEAPLTIEALEYLVLKHFSDIPTAKSDLSPPWMRIEQPGPPFDPKIFHKIYTIPSIYHSEFMAIHWSLDPFLWKNLSTKPLEYLGSVVSDKGESGLYNFLAYFGWATNVTAGSWDSDVFSNNFTTIFTIYIDLTNDGLRNRDLILSAVFSYLEMLKTTEPSLTLFQEVQKQNADYFHHRSARESTSFCEEASRWLQYIPAKFVLVAPQLPTTFDAELISKCTASLDFDTCNIMIFSKSFLKQETEGMNSVESFYQTPYSWHEFSTELCDAISEVKSELSKSFRLPTPNPYFQQLTCCGNQQKNLVKNGPLMIVKGKCSLHYKDEKFQTLKLQMPQAKYVFWFHSPIMHTGIKSETMMDLFAMQMNEMIESKFSSALAAHFRIFAKVSPGKFEISLTGPSHQLSQVTRDIFKILILFEKLLDPQTFHVGKQMYVEKLDNVILDNRIHAWEVLNFMWANHFQLSSEHIRQTAKIDYSSFLSFVKLFKKQIFIAGVFHGFLTIDQAFQVVQVVSSFMISYPKPVKLKEIHALQCPKLPIGESVIKTKSKNLRTQTSVVINGYQFGHLNAKENDIVNFLAKCMSEAAYHSIRTMEQMGYIVLVYYDDVFSVTSMFIEVVTQPKNFSTERCNKRIDEFVAEFYVTNFSDETSFQQFLQGKPPFNYTLAQVQALFTKYLLPNPDSFRKLSVQVTGNLLDGFVLTQKSHVRGTPVIFGPDLSNEYSQLESGESKKIKNEKRTKDVEQLPKPPKIILTPENYKLRKPIYLSETNLYCASSYTNRRNSAEPKKLRRGYYNTPEKMKRSNSLTPSAAKPQSIPALTFPSFSRFVKDIHVFKKSLELYPNRESVKIDESLEDEDESVFQPCN